MKQEYQEAHLKLKLKGKKPMGWPIKDDWSGRHQKQW